MRSERSGLAALARAREASSLRSPSERFELAALGGLEDGARAQEEAQLREAALACAARVEPAVARIVERGHRVGAGPLAAAAGEAQEARRGDEATVLKYNGWLMQRACAANMALCPTWEWVLGQAKLASSEEQLRSALAVLDRELGAITVTAAPEPGASPPARPSVTAASSATGSAGTAANCDG